MEVFVNKYNLFIILMLLSTVYCKITLNIAGLIEQTNIPPWFREVPITPRIAEITLDKINRSNFTNVLQDYELKMITRDIQFSSGLGARIMMELLTEDPPKLAVFGPVFSNNLAVTAQIAPFFNVIEVACFDVAASLSNAQLYPTLFTVNYNLHVLNPVLIAMMDHFGWSRIGTISNTADLFAATLAILHELLTTHNKTLVSTAAVLETKESASEIIKRFKQYDVRIILMAVERTSINQLFCQDFDMIMQELTRLLTLYCEIIYGPRFLCSSNRACAQRNRGPNMISPHRAYHERLYGPGYVWISIGPTMYGKPNFDSYDEEEAGCSLDELLEASAGLFVLNYYVVSRTNTMTTFGERPTEVMEELVDKLQYNINELQNYWRGGFGMTVDSMWAIALGLNNSIKYLDEMGLKLHEYNYSKVYLDAVMKGMSEVNFNGVSGPVSFSKTGQRIAISYIQKTISILNDSFVDVARFDSVVDKLEWMVPPSSLWLNGKVPLDSFTHTSQSVTPSAAAFAIVITMDVCGTALALGFLAFNIHYRNNRSVKMSSPTLNNVIIAGSLLMYLEVIVASLDYIQASDTKTRSYMCMVEAWILSLGFTSLFGALFSKTYRVYVIFRNYKLQRKHIKDLHLFGILIGLVVVDVIIVLPWSIFHPMTKREIVLSKQTLVESNVILSEVYHYCYNPQQGYYLAALYVYKGLLLAFGTFLAWETRAVTVPELNDSKLIGACIYNVVVVCIFGVPLAHVLSVDQATLIYVLESCLIIFCTTICQCIIFVPKLQSKNQVQPRFVTNQMSRRTKTESMNDNTTCSTSNNMATDIKVGLTAPSNKDSVDIDEIMAENKKLRMQIAQESIAIAKLRRGLQHMTGNIHFYRSGSQYVLFKTDNSGMDGVKEGHVSPKE